MSRFLTILSLLAASVLLLSRCSIVVRDTENMCGEMMGCEPGETCQNGQCVVCVGNTEVCDGLDNDCDGETDEGLGGIPDVCDGVDNDCDMSVDEDAGNVEFCDNIDNDCDMAIDEGLGGIPDVCDGVDNDCDMSVDEDAQNVMEVCNGLDDNCNGMADEGAGLCGSNALCNAGECMIRDCSNDESRRCDEGFLCDERFTPAQCVSDVTPCRTREDCGSPNMTCSPNGICIDVIPTGEPCTTSASCGDGKFCQEVSTTGSSGNMNIRTCVSTCCRTSDCAEGELCTDTLRGVKYCLPQSLAGRAPGDSCNSNTVCASRFCRQEGAASTCVEECSSHSDCDSNRCAIIRHQESVRWACIGGEGRPDGATCIYRSDCNSLACSTGGQCFDHCHGEGTCPGDQGCRYFAAFNTEISLCIQGALGRRSCTSGSDCASNVCEDGECRQICCSNAQCPSGYICTPRRAGNRFRTYCEPARSALN